MAVEFRDVFDLAPIPVDARRAAWQATLLRQKVEDAGGYEAGVTGALEAIRRGQTDPPTELGRLRALYAVAYSDAELHGLVSNTFTGLGIVPEDRGG